MEIKRAFESNEFDVSDFKQDQFKQDLLSDANILKVIEELQLDEEVIDDNLTVLSQYLRILRKDPSLPKGMFLDDYDVKLVHEMGILNINYQKKPELIQKEKEELYLKNVWINHFPSSFKTIKPENLSFAHYKEIGKVKDLVSLKIDSTKGYFVYGTVGIGKTYLLAAKAQQFAKEGHSVCFVNMNRILSELKQSFSTDEVFVAKTLNQLMNCEFLVLDDVGAETNTAWSRDEVLFQVLDYRMEHQKLTCFSSNLDEEKIAYHYGKTYQGFDEIKSVRIMERIHVLSDFLLLTSYSGSLRKAS